MDYQLQTEALQLRKLRRSREVARRCNRWRAFSE